MYSKRRITQMWWIAWHHFPFIYILEPEQRNYTMYSIIRRQAELNRGAPIRAPRNFRLWHARGGAYLERAWCTDGDGDPPVQSPRQACSTRRIYTKRTFPCGHPLPVPSHHILAQLEFITNCTEFVCIVIYRHFARAHVQFARGVWKSAAPKWGSRSVLADRAVAALALSPIWIIWCECVARMAARLWKRVRTHNHSSQPHLLCSIYDMCVCRHKGWPKARNWGVKTIQNKAHRRL